MNNKMITIPYADAIEYGENTSALFKALWELTDLIRLESDLKKHHRAYLHVHEELEDCADEMAARMQEIFDETTDCVIGLMKDVHETFRVRKQEAAEDDADTVTIAKEGGNPVPANSILSVMGLGIKQGDSVVIDVQGADDETVADNLLNILVNAE